MEKWKAFALENINSKSLSLVSSINASLVYSHRHLALNILLEPLLQKVFYELDHAEDSSLESTQLQWYLQLLKKCLARCGSEIILLSSSFIRLLSFDHNKLSYNSSKLLYGCFSSAFSGLCEIYPLEICSFSKEFLDDPSKINQHYKYWGMGGKAQAEISWHKPDEASVELSMQFMNVIYESIKDFETIDCKTKGDLKKYLIKLKTFIKGLRILKQEHLGIQELEQSYYYYFLPCGYPVHPDSKEFVVLSIWEKFCFDALNRLAEICKNDSDLILAVSKGYKTLLSQRGIKNRDYSALSFYYRNMKRYFLKPYRPRFLSGKISIHLSDQVISFPSSKG